MESAWCGMENHEMILLSADMKSVHARLSRKVYQAEVAQLVEPSIRNREVRGSRPRLGSSFDSHEEEVGSD